jgi:High-affinity nickel-transport protein
MTEASSVSILIFGFLLGLKHAVEADHVAAVSTIGSEHSSILRSSFVGAWWGIGHTISLLLAGAAIVLFQIEISDQLSLFFEFLVGVMLIGMGANALLKLMRGGHLHMHVHQHGGRAHTHPHIHDVRAEPDPQSHHGLGLQRRPLIVGMIHGLAGSGALMLLILSTIRQPAPAFTYLLVFSVGSTGGMMLMSTLVGLPAKLTGQRFRGVSTIIRGIAGAFSVLLGTFMTYQIVLRGLG